jgi:hypothetical protein
MSGKKSGTDFPPDLFNGFEELLCAIVLNKLKTRGVSGRRV